MTNITHKNFIGRRFRFFVPPLVECFPVGNSIEGNTPYTILLTLDSIKSSEHDLSQYSIIHAEPKEILIQDLENNKFIIMSDFHSGKNTDFILAEDINEEIAFRFPLYEKYLRNRANSK